MTGIQLPKSGIWTGVDFGENVKVRADAQAFVLDAQLFPHWTVDYDTTDEGVDTLGYKGGIAISAAGAVSVIADGTVLLTDNATNYVERTLAGVVSANTVGYTSGRLPMFKVVVAAHVFTSITDHRMFGAQLAATLLAIQQLTGAADKGVYFTSASAAALFDLSAFTRGITGSADAAAWRTALSVPSSAELAAVVAGLDFKDNVRARTTANVDLAGGGIANGTTHDGVTVATGERILVAAQTAPEENGIYIVPAAGAASRATDADSWAELVSAFVAVSEGTTYAESLWVMTGNQGGTLGVTAVNWAHFNAGTVLSTGITDSTSAGRALLTAADDDAQRALLNVDDNGFPYVIDGGGAVVTTGEKAGYVRVPFDGHITGWTLLGDPAHTGSIVIDSWIDTYANFPPTVADSIWGGSKPTLASADKAEATGLSIAVTKGQLIRHKVDSAATLWEATLNYHMTRS